MTYLASKAIEFRKKMQKKGYYGAKVIKIGTVSIESQCDFLLVINTN